MNLPLSVSWNSNLPHCSSELWQAVYLDQKTSTSMQNNARRRTKTWRILKSKLQRLTLLEINTTEEKQTQTWTQAPARVWTRMQRWLIAASVPSTFPTAISLPLHWILPWPCSLLVAMRQDLPGRKLLSCSVKTDVSTAKKSETIDHGTRRNGDQWQSLQTQQHWPGLMLAK